MDFSKLPLTLIPGTGRRLDYYSIYSLDIGVTDVAKNSRIFAVTSTTCSTLLLAICLKLFFQPIDIQHTQCPYRFIILETKALQSQASRQTHASQVQQDTIHIRGILMHVASGLFPGVLRRGSWHFQAASLHLCNIYINHGPLSASHNISTSPSRASVAGGECRPQSEALCM